MNSEDTRNKADIQVIIDRLEQVKDKKKPQEQVLKNLKHCIALIDSLDDNQ